MHRGDHPGKRLARIEGSFLEHYIFDWGRGKTGLALGNGSLYNYSAKPNSEVIWIPEQARLCYIATRKIAKGEEICFDYGYVPDGYSKELDSGLMP